MNTEFYLSEIAKERIRQDEKFGEQNHHPLVWFSIIGEEFGEMCKAYNDYTLKDDDSNSWDAMQQEAVQTAACCVAMLECLDRMAEKGLGPETGR